MYLRLTEARKCITDHPLEALQTYPPSDLSQVGSKMVKEQCAVVRRSYVNLRCFCHYSVSRKMTECINIYVFLSRPSVRNKVFLLLECIQLAAWSIILITQLPVLYFFKHVYVFKIMLSLQCCNMESCYLLLPHIYIFFFKWGEIVLK